MKKEDKREPIKLSVKLHPDVVTLIEQLAEFLDNSSQDHVVSEAVRDVAKGREFQAWLAAKEARMQTLQLANGAGKPSGKRSPRPGEENGKSEVPIHA